MPDTLLHVQGRGNGRTGLRVEKARHSSRWHDTPALSLAWAPGKSYTVEDRAPVSADTMADDILAAVREHPGESWTQLRNLRRDASTKLITGNLDQAAAVRDRLIDDGLLVNTAPRQGQFRLHLTDDPDPARSDLRTGLERATFPHGAGDNDPTRSPFPPIRNGVTGTGHPDTATEAER